MRHTAHIFHASAEIVLQPFHIPSPGKSDLLGVEDDRVDCARMNCELRSETLDSTVINKGSSVKNGADSTYLINTRSTSRRNAASCAKDVNVVLGLPRTKASSGTTADAAPTGPGNGGCEEIDGDGGVTRDESWIGAEVEKGELLLLEVRFPLRTRSGWK